MNTSSFKHVLHVLGLTMLVLVWGPVAVSAQQSLDVPAAPSQGQPPIYYRQRPTPAPRLPSGSEVRTIPSAVIPQQAPPETPPPPPAYQPEPAPRPMPPPLAEPQPEPVLPAVFRGCWEGRVSSLDSIERLPGGPRLGTWTPKTYRLCYRRIGDGPFVLTFTEAGIAANRKITNATGRMTPLSTDGRSYASMRAFLHFDEFRTNASYFGGSTFAVDELTNLQCDVEPDGMHVRGQVFGEHDGRSWFRAWWHSVFVHVPAPPETAPAGGIPE
jgi:hypothetical protein